MKILESQVAAFVTAILLDIKRGCFDAQKNGDVVLRLPDKVDFQMEIVKDAFNGIVRTSTMTPSADDVTTTVDAAYDETTDRSSTTTPESDEVTTMVADAFEETTTQTPATTQTDDSAQNGADISTDTTNYDQFTYTSS